MPAQWHDDARKFFFPQWTRPDGTVAGVLWTTVPAGMRELRFDATDMRFSSHLGHPLAPTRTASGTYLVPVSGDPVFFEGGKLVCE